MTPVKLPPQRLKPGSYYFLSNFSHLGHRQLSPRALCASQICRL
jgi:hypothetical protein